MAEEKEREYISIEEACKILGKNEDEFKVLAEEKGLRSLREGDSVRFKRAEVVRLVEGPGAEGGLDEVLKSDDDFLLFTEEEKTTGSDTLELLPEQAEKAPSAPTVSIGTRGPDTKADTKGDSRSGSADTKDETKSDTKLEAESADLDGETRVDTQSESSELDLGDDLFELEPMEEEEDTGTAGVFDQLDIIEEEEESGSTDEVTGQVIQEEEEGVEETILEGTEALEEEEGEEISPEEIQRMAEQRLGVRAAGPEAAINPAWPVLVILAAIAGIWALLMAVNQLVPNSGVQSINAILVDVFKNM